MTAAHNKRKFLILAFLLGWTGILIGISMFGWTATWKNLLVTTMYPPFADMRTVQGALESIADGRDPQVGNPGDPWNRKMNYPTVWIWIAGALNFQNDFNFLVFVSAALLSYLYYCYKILLYTNSIWALLIAFSGSSLLAIERGNNDLVVFSLLYLSAIAPKALGVLSILVATALKIYPLLVIPAFIKEKVTVTLLVIGSITLLFFMSGELASIRAGTPVSWHLSYGSPSIVAAFKGKLGLTIPHPLISLLLVIGATIIYASRFKLVELSAKDASDIGKRLFCIGACIFVGTFLLSSNWDYRLIFLILCVPYVLLLASAPLRYTILACMLAATNQIPLLAVFGVIGMAANILAKCILFVSLSSLTLNLLETEIGVVKKFLSRFPQRR